MTPSSTSSLMRFRPVAAALIFPADRLRAITVSTMSQTTEIPKKRRGPVPTGKGQPIVVRTQPDLLSALDRWIARHPEPKPSRPEAVRRVLVKHLTSERLLPSRPDLRKSRKAAK